MKLHQGLHGGSGSAGNRLVQQRDIDRTAEVGAIHEYLRTVADLADHGRLRPLIDSVHALDKAGRAHERAEGGQAFGKVVIVV